MHHKFLKVLHSKVCPCFFLLALCTDKVAQSLTFSEGAQLIADGAERLVFGQGSVICNPALHVHHHLLLLIQKRHAC